MGTERWVRLATRIRAFLQRGEDGQGLVEYSLILSFVVIVVYFALKFLQPQINSTLNSVTMGL